MDIVILIGSDKLSADDHILKRIVGLFNAYCKADAFELLRFVLTENWPVSLFTAEAILGLKTAKKPASLKKIFGKRIE